MDYYPIFTKLSQRRVIVVGAGDVAAKKIAALLKAEASIYVVARDLCPQIHSLHQANTITWLAQEYQANVLEGAFLVVVATNDTQLNARISQDAEAQSTLVNVVDNTELCSYIVPAIVDRSPLQIAISSSGTAPVLARQIRKKIEMDLPAYYGDLARLAGIFRQKVQSVIQCFNKRKDFWDALFNNRMLHHHVASGNESAAKQLMEAQLHQPQPSEGVVTLVGAGPGNVELLTIAGLQALQAADIVLSDANVSEAIINLIRKDAKIIDVGKKVGESSHSQTQINQKLIHYAQKGLNVVRLKGGDPFIFGRGGEECQALFHARIPFKIIPGITAATGVAAFTGIPLTHRDYTQSVIFLTGHNQKNYPIDWQAMAKPNQTLVVYMGTVNAKTITQKLLDYGRAVDTPVAVVSHGTLKSQTTQTGILSNLPSLAANAPRPALILIGEVVALHDNLNWFSHNALS